MLNCSSHTTTFTKGTPNEQWRNTFISSVQLDSRPNSDLQRRNDQIRLPHKFAPIVRQSQSGSALCTVIGPSSRTGTANTRSHSSLGNDLTTDPSRSTALRETAPMDCGRTSLLHMRLPFQIWAGAPDICASGDRSASSLDKAVITPAGEGVGYTPIEMQNSVSATHLFAKSSACTSSRSTQAGYFFSITSLLLVRLVDISQTPIFGRKKTPYHKAKRHYLWVNNMLGNIARTA